MKFLERDLEDILHEKMTQENGFNELAERGVYFNHKGFGGKPKKVLRQPRIGNYGIADIVLIDYVKQDGYLKLFIEVVELKKDKISMSAFLQAVGYCKGIQRYLRKRGFNCVDFSVVLIGNELDNKSQLCYLPDLTSDFTGFDINFYTYKMEWNGMNFKLESGYALGEEGF